jgi:hypothetical protein
MGILTLSDKYTGYVFLRYFAHDIADSFCAIYLPPNIKEQIEIAQVLHDTAEGHINSLSAIKCYFNEIKPTVFFFPDIKMDYFTDDPIFARESKEGRCYWHIKPIPKVQLTLCMACEVIFIEFQKQGLCLVAFPYPNHIVSGVITTATIKYDDIK